jgi:hypothetical protein
MEIAEWLRENWTKIRAETWTKTDAAAHASRELGFKIHKSHINRPLQMIDRKWPHDPVAPMRRSLSASRLFLILGNEIETMGSRIRGYNPSDEFVEAMLKTQEIVDHMATALAKRKQDILDQ